MKVQLFAKGENSREFEVQTKDNETGVKALLTDQKDGGYLVQQVCDVRLTVDSEELRTIWYALKEYYANLQRSLDKHKDEVADQNNVEDLMFIHEQMSQVSKVMFMISTNHDQPMRQLMAHFLDVV